MIILLTLLVIGLAILGFVLLSRIQVLERRVAWLETPTVDTRAEPRAEEELPAEPMPRPATVRAPARIAYAARTAPPPAVSQPTVAAFEAPPPPPEPADTPADPAPPKGISETFENLVGGRLPIWIGGAALVLSAFFLVRYSIENGLLGPQARAMLAAGFGLLLIGASEWARRSPRTADDPRVGQSLAGAGIASLYGTLYMAGELYGLIGGGAAFVLMLIVTGTALGLSIRHGPPTAIMGLIGGFAAPLVTGYSDSNLVPLLIYLALFTAALFGLAISRGWAWLALAAAGAGFAWSGWLIAAIDGTAAAAIGPFILVLAIGAAFALPRLNDDRPVVRAAPLVLGLVQLIMLAPRLDFGPLAWGLYAMLAGATIILAARDPRLITAAGAAGALALLLLAIGLANGAPTAPIAAIVFALLFAGAGHALLTRDVGRTTWTLLALGGSAGPFLLARALWADPVGDGIWALLALAGAASAALVAWRCRTSDAAPAKGFIRADIGHLGGPATAAALVLIGLGPLATPLWLPLLALAVAIAIAAWARKTASPRLAHLALAVIGVAGIAWAAAFDATGPVIEAIFIAAPAPPAITLFATLIGPLALLIAISMLLTDGHAARAVRALAFAAALGLIAAIVPQPWHSAAMALAALAIAWLPGRLRPARAVAATLLVALAYALPVIGQTALMIGQSLIGSHVPMLAAPPLADTLRALGVTAAVAAVIAWFRADTLTPYARRLIWGFVAAGGLIALHALAKGVFAIRDEADFVAWGFTERALITQALLAAAFAAARRTDWRTIALAIAGIAVARIVWFDLLLLNPLLVEQQVGALPVLNAAVLHAAAATVWLWLLSRRLPAPRTWRLLSFAACALTALAIVRQASHGTILTGDFGQGETWSYSAALLAVSIAWLVRGIMTGARDLRIAGLALLTVTTLKVFLIDAAALEGLLRILSFLGLGLALIAIGWAYGKVLKRPA